SGARVDDAAVVLGPHVLPGRLGDVERAPEVDVEHRVEVVGTHVLERCVPQDARVVDHDVDAAEAVQRRLHDGPAALRRGNRVVVGDGVAPSGGDLVDNGLGGGGAAAGAVDRSPGVVGDDQRATAGQLEGVGTSEPATGARDYRNLA